MYILGISALYHDSAASIIKDGEIIAAVQEERFTRKKHDSRLPINAIEYCLKVSGISALDLECVVFYDNPLLTLDRWVSNILALGEDSGDLIQTTFDSTFSERLWIHKKLENYLGSLGCKAKLFVSEHHASHAASAFYPSPFEEAIIIINDGVGEWATTSIGIGKMNTIDLMQEIKYPHSLGLLYSAFTYFCGFKVNSGDYKFMGLAPYGKPIYKDIIKREIIDIKQDGSYRLNLDYFDFHRGKTMINEKKFSELFDGLRRLPESKITIREMNIAASVQEIIEDTIILMARTAKKLYGKNIDNLVLAGGVALNCVANGRLIKEKIFNNIWIQPAAGDSGGALGAALLAYYQYYKNDRIPEEKDSQKGSYLGPRFSNELIREYLDKNEYAYDYYSNEDEYLKKIARYLSEGKIIGLFQGAMEFGPRSLGGRSIIADPRRMEMQSNLNLKIKYRESFRPFAPSVLEERKSDYFELNKDSPYMLLVANVKNERCIDFNIEKYLNQYNFNMLPLVNLKRSDIPAVTHVDYSARIQTVSSDRNHLYYNIIKAFENKTGCGVVVNTSFNVRGEPIVCTPMDAYKCFMRTDMDVLVLENCILKKEEQPVFNEEEDWRCKYELD